MSTVEVVKMHGLLDLSVNQLTFDTDVQCRASIDSGTVTEYKEALGANVVFPPLVVFHDGKTYWVADGFHRGSAYRESGATKCPCDVRQGTKRDAILYAVGANTGHGLRRSNPDKHRAVMVLLNDSEWAQWSNAEVARRAGVSDKTVASLRPAPPSARPALRDAMRFVADIARRDEQRALVMRLAACPAGTLVADVSLSLAHGLTPCANRGSAIAPVNSDARTSISEAT